MAAVGAPHPASSSENSNEIQELARFAVEHHNRKENAALELVRVAKAEEQVVSGTLHHLTLEVREAGKKMIYEAKVWVKPWMDFKEVQEFKLVGDAAPSLTPSDLGAKRGEYGFGWRAVAVDDPSVVAAANDAVKAVQQKSNSLTPYQLHQIVEAKAEVKEEGSKYEMVVKLKRGDKEEKMRVTVHKDGQGALLSTSTATAT